jgi:hypothetical protein
MMLVSVVSVFAQESEITDWGKGLETSFGISSGKGLPDNYSLSFQGVHDLGFGFSLDFIKAADDENRSGLLVNSGLLGSVFLGFPFSKYFIPYVGGGLGIKDNFQDGSDDIGFAWKLDGGASSWLTNTMYAKAGVQYDNIRESISVSVGVGFKFEKTVTASYLDYDGSTFTRTFTKFLWNDNSTPNYIVDKTFLQSEIVSRIRKNVTSVATESYIPGTRTEPSKIGRVYQIIDTYEITVTRDWYTQTYYYKDSAPTSERIYTDTESKVLVDTEKSYLYD